MTKGGAHDALREYLATKPLEKGAWQVIAVDELEPAA
jgi:hypothetical protein